MKNQTRDRKLRINVCAHGAIFGYSKFYLSLLGIQRHNRNQQFKHVDKLKNTKKKEYCFITRPLNIHVLYSTTTFKIGSKNRWVGTKEGNWLIFQSQD